MTINPITPWPKKWPRYKQGCLALWSDACDMIVGPCCCGGTHHKGEFTFRKGVLRRQGKEVDSQVLIPCMMCGKLLELVEENAIQPYGGGEIILAFGYGSTKFDLNMHGTEFKALICDDCAVPLVEKMK